jgi:hypothetical protein
MTRLALAASTLAATLVAGANAASRPNIVAGANAASRPNIVAGANAASRPNIVVIVADDLGWRDVGFSGSNISTPHIDKIASEGVRLTGLYGQPVCSPSRAALHTGRYPISYGLQTYVIDPAGVDYGLNLNETLMPELFKTYGGYQTHVSLCCVARCGAAYKCPIPHLPIPPIRHLPLAHHHHSQACGK